MVHFTRILAVLALLAVSVTAETDQQSTSIISIRVGHHARALASAAGSAGSAAGGSTAVVGGEIPAENAPIVAQWTAAKALLEKAFTGEASLESKLAAFETKVDTTLRGGIATLDEAKKVIGEFLMSLELDPAYTKVADQLTPIKNALGASSTTTAGSAGSGSNDGSKTVGSAGSSANSTVSTPAPTTSAAVSSPLVSAVVSTSVAVAVAAFASL